VLDEELRFVEVNSEFSRFIGRSNQELRGVAFLSTIAPEDLGSSPHLENTLRNARSVSKLDKRFIRKDGQTAWGRVSSRPVRLTDLLGELKPGTIAVIEDIAELKQSEALSQEVQQKLVHAAKMSELGTMAAGIAHEINNPLMIISGKAHQLQRGLDAPDVDRQALKAAAMTIDATTNRIAKIVRGLRVFSRSSERDPFDVENPVRIIEDTLEFCREKIRNNGIELRVRLPDSASQIGSQVPCLECRASDISQVLLNLLSNAYDAVEGTPSAWIELQFTADAGSALFSVTDSGHGLPAAIIEKIMTPFFTTKAVGKGTGLGLSIARGIAVAHKGRLWYDASSPNTRFCLQLPLSQTDAPEFLPIDFDDAIAAHLKWKQRLTTELKKPTRLPQPEEVLCEPRRCALGQWLELISERSCERRSRLELSQIRKAQKLHVQFHEAARKLVVRAHRGEDLFADVVLGADSEYERSSQELMAELMRLRAHSPSADAELMT
jgi:PAS domain S-box-containing protein